MHHYFNRSLKAITAIAPITLVLAFSPAAMAQHSDHVSYVRSSHTSHHAIRSHHGLAHRSQYSSSRHAIPHHYMASRDDHYVVSVRPHQSSHRGRYEGHHAGHGDQDRRDRYRGRRRH